MQGPVDASQAAADQPLAITVSHIAPDTILCVLVGEIDLATAPQLQTELTEVLRATPAHLVIDLSDIEFLGSAGLRLLDEIRTAQHTAGYRLAIVVGHNAVVTRPLHIIGLDQLLDLHVELATAVETCHAPQRQPNHDR